MNASPDATADASPDARQVQAPSLQYEGFEVDPARRQVRRGTQVLPVHARAFDLLMALLERHTRTVGKTELMALVWPDSFVVENNLQVHISALRKLLGAGVIATVPGRGYRFVARPQLATSPPDGSPAAADPIGSRLPGEAASASSLLGRDQDLERLGHLMHTRRLVTVLGAGGIGKTALAQAMRRQLQAQHRQVRWVDLSPLQPADDLARTIGRTLDTPLAPDLPPLAGLVCSLAGQTGWLVLDNAEHLAAEVATLAAALLAGCAPLGLLVTSQVPLKLDAEAVLPLAPLTLPERHTPLAQARQCGGLALFEQQARRWDEGFRIDHDNLVVVLDICKTLGALPLAIQLAAAHCHLLGPEGLRRSLDERFLMLISRLHGGPTRQQTLQAALQWSHTLLGPLEQVVFRRLSIAAGSLSLELAARLAADEAIDIRDVTAALATLVERSLIALEPGPQPRYRLSDTARAFGLLQLDSRQERAEAHRRHALAVLAVIQPAQDAYIDMPEASWLTLYCSDMDHLRAALQWASTADPALGICLLGAAARLYQLTGLFHEALPFTEALAIHVDDDCPPMTATGFWVLRWNALQAVDKTRADEGYARYLASARRTAEPVTLFLALCAGTALGPMSPPQREAAVQEMRQLLQPGWPIYLHTGLWLAEAMLAAHQGRMDAARPLLAQMAEASRTVGKARFAAHGLSILAQWDMAAGAHELAARRAREAVVLQRDLGVWNLMLGLRALASALGLAGHWHEARPCLQEWLGLLRRAHWYGFHLVIDLLALHAAQHGTDHAAAQLLGCAEARFGPGGLARDAVQRLLRQATEAQLATRMTSDDLLRWQQRGEQLSPELAVLLYQAGTGADADPDAGVMAP